MFEAGGGCVANVEILDGADITPAAQRLASDRPLTGDCN
jgi:hypothetical protein